MPSSEPFEITIATFSIVFGAALIVCGCSSSSVIACSLLDAALGLGDAADLGGELGGALREELVELLDRDAGFLAERADRGRVARVEVALAHEADDEPVPVGQLGDPVLPRDLLGDPLVPLLGIGQEAFGVDGDRRVGDQGHGHRAPTFPAAAPAGIFLPASGIVAAMPGMFRPGSSACQYRGWNPSLPRWSSRDSRRSGSPILAG